ncbi:putative inorganic phosphate cotransporter [Macrobrachium nipponense]|uniref:putative inorganic phosphate cotransporter n=1 Tax=Macrobrachium nipponense TaxID=159736 RepID=UPI0030C8703C
MRGESLLQWWPRLLSSTGYSRVHTSEHCRQNTQTCVQQRENELSGPEESSKTNYGERHVLVFLLFLGFAEVYAMRVNLSVAIVAMVMKQSSSHESAQQVEDTCPEPASQESRSSVSVNSGEFDWDEKTQGMILGCFFYGYMLTNYIGGRLAERFGGRLVYGLGVTLTGILTVLSPLAAKHSTGAFMVIRVLEGMTEGVTFPAMNVMVSFWIPPQERARSLARICGGCQFGTVVTLSVSGWLSQSIWGWPAVFYVSGSLAIVWGWFWFKNVYDSPDQHPTISTAEKLFIKQGIGDHRNNKSLDVPWYSILTSTPFLIVIVTHVGNNWGFYCLLTELPTYLKNIQHYDMKQNGVVSAMPYLLMWLFSLFYSSLMDHLLEKRVLTTRQIRQLAMAIGNYIPMVSVLLVPWAGCNGRLAVALICVAVGASGATFCGFHCAFQELAPNFAGTLTGISNTLATIPGFLAPVVTGAIINNQQTLGQWREVFQLVSMVYLVVCSLYLVYMSSDVQPWNEGHTEKRKPVKEITEMKTV